MKAAFVSIVVVLLLTLFVVAAEAQGPYPEGVEVFTVNGETFILAPNGSVLQVCPCYSPCNATPTPTGSIVTQTVPKDTPDPTEEPTIGPTAEPTVEPTEAPTAEPTVEPTEKPKCNRGPGNGSEDCDPGNSGGKPGNAGEDNE